ncbi:MAG: ATP-NAD kinase family protein [Geminicoccaceae bacterium]
MSRRIGLVVNPIAGMGGAVGLKGTDGAAAPDRARELGAVPRAADRAALALRALAPLQGRFALVTCAGAMGEQAAHVAGLAPVLLPLASGEPTTAADTRAAALALRRAGIELLAFAGGDGTARDVHAALGRSPLPILGIPAGVKLRSAVFAPTPARAGAVMAAWLEAAPGTVPLREAELVDIDLADLQADRPVQQLYGTALVPAPRSYVPAAKAAPQLVDEAALDGLARELAAEAEPGRLYLYGPGATTRCILRAHGIDDGTLLGVDAVRDGRLVGRDLGEAATLELLGHGPATIVTGVVGGQGFLFGRGNQQLGPCVLQRVGRDAIVVVAGLEKLATLAPLQLITDTGDAVVDAMLAGWLRVRTAPACSTMVRVVA